MDITGVMNWLADRSSGYVNGAVWATICLVCIVLPLVMARILDRPDPGPVWAQPAVGAPVMVAVAQVAIDSGWEGWDSGADFQQALVLQAGREQVRNGNGNGNGKVSGSGAWYVPSAEQLRDAAIAEASAQRRMDTLRPHGEQDSQYPF